MSLQVKLIRGMALSNGKAEKHPLTPGVSNNAATVSNSLQRSPIVFNIVESTFCQRNASFYGVVTHKLRFNLD